MGLVHPVSVAIVAFATIDAIQSSTILLGLTALPVLLVLLFVVTLIDSHNANILNPRIPRSRLPPRT
jgi:hypothetical protein